MAIDWVQEDTTATCGAASMCSGQTVPGSALTDHSMAEGATGGSNEVLLDIPSGTNDIRLFFQSDQVGELTWEAGTWTVDINVSTASNNLTITGVWICRVDDTCSSVATVASDTTFSRDISSAGTQTFTLSGVATDDTDGGSETDSAYVIVRVQNGHNMTSRSLGITPNETISAPIETTVEPSVAVATNAASDITHEGATLNGDLTEMASVDATDVWFDWGESGAGLPNSTTAETLTSTGTFAHSISSLTAETAYEFQAQADGDSGTATDSGTVETVTTGMAIAGTVTRPDDTAADGATVRVRDSNNTIVATTTTDANGDYSMSVPAGGTYHVVVQHDDGTDQFNAESYPYVE